MILRTLKPLLCLWIAMAAGVAAAQDSVRVRSGEHGQFSRLVFYFPEDRDWRLGRQGDGYRLGVDGAPFTYDLSEVFEFIPRTRIAALTPDQEGVKIDLACDCHVDAFAYRPDVLVLDVKDGPPEKSEFETPYAPFRVQADTAQAARGNDRAKQAGAFPSLAELFTAGRARPEGESREDRNGAPTRTADPASLRVDMTSRLSAALSQGLLVPGDTPPSAREVGEVDVAEDQSSTARPGILDTGQSGADEPQAQGYRVSTAFDIAFGGRAAAAIDAPECRPEADFAFLSSQDSEPLAAVSSARLNVLDGAGTSRPDAILDLSRAYLSLGFGREALQVLQAYAAVGTDAEFLADLAVVMDRPSAVPPNTVRRLAAQASCDSSGAVWALLATGGLALPDQVNGEAVLRSVSALPLHLRRHLVPSVSEALRTAGQPELAQAVRRTLERADQEPQPEMLLETARAGDAKRPEPAVASAAMPVVAMPAATPSALDSPAADMVEPVVARTTEVAPVEGRARPEPALSEPGLGALADILDQMARGRRPIDDERLTEAAALIHESKGSDAGNAVFEAFLPVLMRSSRHRDALALVRRLEASAHAEAYDLSSAAAVLMSDLAERGRPSDLVLAIAEGGAAVAPSALPAATRYAVSERLLALGLLEQARAYAPMAGPGAGAETRLLHAGIALAEGEPMEALARIATLEGTQARRLRAEALASAGASAEAARLLGSEVDDETAGQLAWAGGDWSASANLLRPGPRRDLARLLAAGLVPEESNLDATGTIPGAAAVGEAAGADRSPVATLGSGNQAASGAPGSLGALAARQNLIVNSEQLRETIRQSLSAVQIGANTQNSGT